MFFIYPQIFIVRTVRRRGNIGMTSETIGLCRQSVALFLSNPWQDLSSFEIRSNSVRCLRSARPNSKSQCLQSNDTPDIVFVLELQFL
jgi:hypothetical protein